MLNILSGVAVLVVVLCPTDLPKYPPNHLKAGERDTSINLTAIQDWLGPECVKNIHLVAATVFIVSIGMTSFIFGARERDRRRKKPHRPGRLGGGG